MRHASYPTGPTHAEGCTAPGCGVGHLGADAAFHLCDSWTIWDVTFESGVMLTATHPVRIERTPAIGQFVWRRPDQGANVSFEGEAIDAGELQNQHPSDGGADKLLPMQSRRDRRGEL